MLTEIKSAIASQLSSLSDRARILNDDTDGEAGSNSQVRNDYTIRVGFAGTTFNPPPTTQLIGLQECNRSFEVKIEIRDFRNEDKTLELLEAAENLLLGYCPCVKGVTGEIYLESDRFLKNEKGIYFYVINIAVPCVIVK